MTYKGGQGWVVTGVGASLLVLILFFPDLLIRLSAVVYHRFGYFCRGHTTPAPDEHNHSHRLSHRAYIVQKLVVQSLSPELSCVLMLSCTCA